MCARRLSEVEFQRLQALENSRPKEAHLAEQPTTDEQIFGLSRQYKEPDEDLDEEEDDEDGMD